MTASKNFGALCFVLFAVPASSFAIMPKNTPFAPTSAVKPGQRVSTALFFETLKKSKKNEVSPSSPPPSVDYNRETLKRSSGDDKISPAELIGLGAFMAASSGFILYNNYVGPFPVAVFEQFSGYWPLIHVLSGMVFGGGIIITTLIEWIVVDSKRPDVNRFWFDKVPTLNSAIVLPALVGSIFSGTARSSEKYGMLSDAPAHVTGTLAILVAFAVWFAVTDLTSQGKAKEAITQWQQESEEVSDPPNILILRRYSNVVSCLFVVALYAVMVLKPGCQ